MSTHNEEWIDKLFAEIQQVNSKLTVIQTQIQGNGMKGIGKRLEDVEQWQVKHPQECQRKTAKARALEISFIGIVIAGVQLILKALKVF